MSAGVRVAAIIVVGILIYICKIIWDMWNDNDPNHELNLK